MLTDFFLFHEKSASRWSFFYSFIVHAAQRWIRIGELMHNILILWTSIYELIFGCIFHIFLFILLSIHADVYTEISGVSWKNHDTFVLYLIFLSQKVIFVYLVHSVLYLAHFTFHQLSHCVEIHFFFSPYPQTSILPFVKNLP